MLIISIVRFIRCWIGELSNRKSEGEIGYEQEF